MPIDFPNNPIAGQTYAYGDQKWQFNGVAWDKLFIADDANALYGISGSIYASSLATGLLYGGILSINAGNSAQFDITAGRGQIHAAGSTYTANPQPTLQYVTWAGQTGITLTYLATNDTTWIYIDSAGNLQQRTEYYTDDQLEENIIIGQLIHPSRTFINLARTNPNVAYATDKQYEQFIRSFGPIKISGHTIQPNGANLKLNRTSGTAFSLGRNWINDTDNPSVVSDSAQTDCIFYRYYRGVTAGSFITVPNQTAIDPTKYDDGTGTLAIVPGGKYTIQRLFYYPNTPTLLGVYYGRAQYTSLADAAANINFENFTEIENTKTNAIFVAYLLIKSGCTDITNTSDALILQAGNFRSTTSGGGSVSLTLDDLTDVIITSPQNNQVLTYVDGTTGWENRSVTTLPLVSSIRGLTGAVGITNGSGIGLSVSGQTMTFSNTGVLSINGGTGAVINVARTNVNNNFTTNQSIDPSLQVVDTNVTGNYITIEPSSNQITNFQDLTSATGILQFSQPTGFGYTVTIPATTTVLAGLSNTQTFTSTNTFNALTSFSSGISAAGATFTGLARFTAGISASGGITFSPRVYVDGNILTSPNGVIESGYNGWFRGLQWIDPNGGRARIVLNYSSTPRSIDFKVDGVSFDGSGELTRMQLFASGLSCSQGATFRNSINVTGNVLASGGISAAGGTFGGNIILENAEFIRNSTNGRIDLMPAPAGSTHYGLSIDTTSWGYGPRLGTIRSSDNALNTAAILWDVPPTLAANVRFNFGSNGQNGVVLSDTGNDTIQLFTNVTSGTNSGAIAIVDAVGINAANRAPGTTHANPNLYIYRAGNARATDFIRFEHDGNTGYMITGGTTDIELMPGSGIVGVSGNIQVLQNQIYVTNNARSWFL